MTVYCNECNCTYIQSDTDECPLCGSKWAREACNDTPVDELKNFTIADEYPEEK